MKYLFRSLNVIVSAAIAYFIFNFTYIELLSYLPDENTLLQMNTVLPGRNLNAMLAENTNGLRELYLKSFEKSVTIAFFVFIACSLSIEYVYRRNTVKADVEI